MKHWGILQLLGVLGLICGILGLLSHHRAHPEDTRGRALWSICLALWAIGLMSSFIGI